MQYAIILFLSIIVAIILTLYISRKEPEKIIYIHEKIIKFIIMILILLATLILIKTFTNILGIITLLIRLTKEINKKNQLIQQANNAANIYIQNYITLEELKERTDPENSKGIFNIIGDIINYLS